nr:MAG TPA: hypothetical protein [Caudoviricetes sp.]
MPVTVDLVFSLALHAQNEYILKLNKALLGAPDSPPDIDETLRKALAAAELEALRIEELRNKLDDSILAMEA